MTLPNTSKHLERDGVQPATPHFINNTHSRLHLWIHRGNRPNRVNNLVAIEADVIVRLLSHCESHLLGRRTDSIVLTPMRVRSGYCAFIRYESIC
jgi:hypothetical protein